MNSDSNKLDQEASPGSERRRHTRVNLFGARVEIDKVNDRRVTLKTTVVNVSASGLYIRLPSPSKRLFVFKAKPVVSKDDLLTFRIFLPPKSEPIVAAAKVVRVDRTNDEEIGIGLEFSSEYSNPASLDRVSNALRTPVANSQRLKVRAEERQRHSARLKRAVSDRSGRRRRTTAKELERLPSAGRAAAARPSAPTKDRQQQGASRSRSASRASSSAHSTKSSARTKKSSAHSTKSSAHSTKSSAHSTKSSARTKKSSARTKKSSAHTKRPSARNRAEAEPKPLQSARSSDRGSALSRADSSKGKTRRDKLRRRARTRVQQSPDLAASGSDIAGQHQPS